MNMVLRGEEFLLQSVSMEDPEDSAGVWIPRIKLEGTESPAPSCLSTKSDWSMHPPENFNERVSTPDIRIKQEGTESPAPSCLSVKSDWSMHPPENFNGRVSTPDIRFKQEGTESPAPSCLSMKSDWSMHPPENFNGRVSTPDIRFKQEGTESPAPSCLSMKSDWSMHPPENFKRESWTPDLSEFSSSLLNEDHFRCSVCSEVLRDPVSIPCGHSYCGQCISTYWAQPGHAGDYVCPQCSKRSATRPVLSTNKALAMVIQAVQKAGFSPALPALAHAGPGDVACDICSGHKLRAVKTCLTCSASYCESHIKQHYTVPALQRHTLAQVTGDEECTRPQDTAARIKCFKEANPPTYLPDKNDVKTEEEEETNYKKRKSENLVEDETNEINGKKKIGELEWNNYYLEQENIELKNICKDLEQENSELKNSLKLKEKEDSELKATEDLLEIFSKDLEQRVSETLKGQLTMTMMNGCHKFKRKLIADWSLKVNSGIFQY